MQNKHIIQAIWLIYLFLILLVNIIPLSNAEVPSLHKIYFLGIRVDLLLHVLIFIPLVPLWHLSRSQQNIWTILLYSIIIAFAAEFIHYLLPYRSFDMGDMFANVIGVFPGFITVWLVKRNQ